MRRREVEASEALRKREAAFESTCYEHRQRMLTELEALRSREKTLDEEQNQLSVTFDFFGERLPAGLMERCVARCASLAGCVLLECWRDGVLVSDAWSDGRTKAVLELREDGPGEREGDGVLARPAARVGERVGELPDEGALRRERGVPAADVARCADSKRARGRPAREVDRATFDAAAQVEPA